MTKLRIKPALYYQLDAMWKATLTVAGIMAAVIILISLLANITVDSSNGSIDISIAGFLDFNIGTNIVYFSAASVLLIMVFVIGIGGIREDFKFYLQHGMGRMTTYLSTLLISLITGAVLGLFCEILNLISANWSAFPVVGFRFPTGNFFYGWLLHLFSFVLAWQFGTLLSLIYYRLSKMGKVVFTVAWIALIIFGFPSFIVYAVNSLIPGDIAALGAALVNLFENPISLMLILLVMGTFCAALNFLLLRRAQARE